MFIPSDDRFRGSLPSSPPKPAADLAAPSAFPLDLGAAAAPTFLGAGGSVASGSGARADLNGAAPAGAGMIVQYRVEVGHLAVAVRGASTADAIRLARSRLCLELPRLWDVIRTMDESNFRVAIVEEHK